MIVLLVQKDLESISNTETFLRFRINDTDIIGTAHLTDPDRNDFRVFHDLKNWRSIIHLALWGLRAVRALDVVHTTWIEDISETGEDLLLKRVGGCRDDDFAAAQNGGDEVRERFARTGTGFDEEVSLILQCVVNGARHHELAFAMLVSFEPSREGGGGPENLVDMKAGCPRGRPDDRRTGLRIPVEPVGRFRHP